MSDPVHHPDHYNSHPSGVETRLVTGRLPFNLGNAIKYVWRAGIKDPTKLVQDYEKALFYLNEEAAIADAARPVPFFYEDSVTRLVQVSMRYCDYLALVERVQHGRYGNLEGLLRALFRLTCDDDRCGHITTASIHTSILFLEGAIENLRRKQFMNETFGRWPGTPTTPATDAADPEKDTP